MSITKLKPNINSQRNVTNLDYKKILSNDEPEKSLLVTLNKKSGRNNSGKITVRHRGGGHKRKYRLIDFKRNKYNIEATVKTIEYDPNRTANIALLHYKDGEKRYILAPKGLAVGSKVISGPNADIQIGNALPLENIPEGTFVHNIEMKPLKGGQIARSAGMSAQILGKDEQERYVIIKLKSNEVRKILGKCYATIGTVGNENFNLIKLGKAGRTRHRGIKPTVRGSAMNPNDHPHGGGEGKAPIGHKSPMTPWGKRALGVKTRDLHKNSSKMIIRTRHQAKKK